MPVPSKIKRVGYPRDVHHSNRRRPRGGRTIFGDSGLASGGSVFDEGAKI